jgi:hypothetical protein
LGFARRNEDMAAEKAGPCTVADFMPTIMAIFWASQGGYPRPCFWLTREMTGGRPFRAVCLPGVPRVRRLPRQGQAGPDLHATIAR